MGRKFILFLSSDFIYDHVINFYQRQKTRDNFKKKFISRTISSDWNYSHHCVPQQLQQRWSKYWLNNNFNKTMGSIRLTLIIYIIMLPFCLWYREKTFELQFFVSSWPYYWWFMTVWRLFVHWVGWLLAGLVVVGMIEIYILHRH